MDKKTVARLRKERYWTAIHKSYEEVGMASFGLAVLAAIAVFALMLYTPLPDNEQVRPLTWYAMLVGSVLVGLFMGAVAFVLGCIGVFLAVAVMPPPRK